MRLSDEKAEALHNSLCEHISRLARKDGTLSHLTVVDVDHVAWIMMNWWAAQDGVHETLRKVASSNPDPVVK